MFHGFYNLTSGILTQNRSLDVISNNMVNVSTPGYKSDKLTTTTFQEEMRYRTGTRDKSNPVQLATMSMIRTPLETVTRHDQGAFEETGSNLDFALESPGFFVVQGDNGGTFYTRNGSFTMDNEGFLCLPGVGRVQGENGPIQLTTDQIEVDSQGNIYEIELREPRTGDDGDTEEEATERTPAARFRIVDFEDYNQLTRAADGCFTAAGAAAAPVAESSILWKYVERSNVDPVEEMTAMMSGQRSIQSAAQLLKMYDQLMGRIVSDIGKV